MPKLKRIGWCLAVSAVFCAAGSMSAVGGAGAMALPELHPPEFESPPVIDGVVTEAVWVAAAVFNLTNPVGGAAGLCGSTDARMGYDAAYLYLAVRCGQMPGAGHAPADRLEAFLGTSPAQYFQFTVAHDGHTVQQAVKQDACDADWTAFWHCATTNGPGWWSAELALPLYILGRTVLPPEQLRFNLARVYAANVSGASRASAEAESGVFGIAADSAAAATAARAQAVLSWAPLGEAAQKHGLQAGAMFGRLRDLNRLRIAPVLPRILSARVTGPYQAGAAGGHYQLEIAAKNPSAGRLSATVLARETIISAELPAPAAASLRTAGTVDIPAWAGATNVFEIAVPDMRPRLTEVCLENPAFKQDWFEADGASLLTPGVRPAAGAELAGYGANAVELGEPIGGGAGYSRMVGTADVEVAAAEELAAVLNDWNARPAAEVAGKTIRVAAGADWDLAGVIDPGAVKPYQPLFSVPAGVTLAGDRGRAGAPGPILRFSLAAGAPADLLAQKTLIRLGAGARLTGLRLRGPDIGHQDPASAAAANSRFRGVSAGPGAEVDNCQISHFAWSDVDVSAPDVRVRCNELSDSAYPVLIGGSNGQALIEGNLIRWAWHALAGSGHQGTGYEAAHNRFVHIGPGWPAHAVDMHAWRRLMRGYGSEYPFLSVAADRVLVHHNTFEDQADLIRAYRAARSNAAPAEASCGVCIRGVTRQGVEIYNNCFTAADPGRACRLVDNVGAPPGCLDRANFWVRDNLYGPERLLVPLPRETLPRIRFVKPGLAVPRIGGKFSTRHVNVLRPDEKIPVEILVEAMPPLELRRVTVAAGNLEQAEKTLYEGARAPAPGELELDAAAWPAGCYALTVTAEDTRGVTARHSTSFTVGGE